MWQVVVAEAFDACNMQKVSYFNKKQGTTSNCGYKSIKISAFNIVKKCHPLGLSRIGKIKFLHLPRFGFSCFIPAATSGGVATLSQVFKFNKQERDLKENLASFLQSRKFKQCV